MTKIYLIYNFKIIKNLSVNKIMLIYNNYKKIIKRFVINNLIENQNHVLNGELMVLKNLWIENSIENKIKISYIK